MRHMVAFASALCGSDCISHVTIEIVRMTDADAEGLPDL